MWDSHPHAVEEMEFEMGRRNPLQLAFDEANQLFPSPAGDEAKIAELVAGGRFCVVVVGENFCPWTDASRGTHDCLESDHATREEADAAAEAIALSGDWVKVVPEPVRPEPPGPFLGEGSFDEIPF